MELVTEMQYALTCYEDGTLSPRRILQRLLNELTELEESAFRLVTQGPSQSSLGQKGFASSLDLAAMPQPITPESSSMPSYYSPDDMELMQDLDSDFEGSSNQQPS